MGEPKGPSGIPPIKPVSEDITKRPEEGVVVPGQLVEMEAMADAFASICAENLDQDLTSEAIREKMVAKGFPKGLASYLGVSLLERIKDARQTLAVAATKPKLKDALVGTVREEIIEYFKSREAEIIKFFEISENPMTYLDIMANVLPDLNFSNFTIDQLNQFTTTMGHYEINEDKVLRRVGQVVKKILEDELKIEVGAISEPDMFHGNFLRISIGVKFPFKDSTEAYHKLQEINDYLKPKFRNLTFSNTVPTNITPRTNLEIWFER